MLALRFVYVVLEVEASEIERRLGVRRNRHLLSLEVSGESSTDCENVTVSLHSGGRSICG